jgi:hypothetical protein
MPAVTYRNAFFAFAIIYLSAWLWLLGGQSSEPKIEIPDDNNMSGVETAISAIGAVVLFALVILLVFVITWVVIKTFTGYSMTLWEIFLYVFIIGGITVFAVSFLIGIVVAIPQSVFLSTASGGEDAGAFANNLSAISDLAVTALVAAWAGGIFVQRVNKQQSERLDSRKDSAITDKE